MSKIEISASLEDFTSNPDHTTDGRHAFAYQVVLAECMECRASQIMGTLELAEQWALGHAYGHQLRKPTSHNAGYD